MGVLFGNFNRHSFGGFYEHPLEGFEKVEEKDLLRREGLYREHSGAAREEFCMLVGEFL